VALFCCCLKPGDVGAADIQSLLLQASSGTKQPKKQQQQQQQQHKPKPKPTSSVPEFIVDCTPIEWGDEVEEVSCHASTQLNSGALTEHVLCRRAAAGVMLTAATTKGPGLRMRRHRSCCGGKRSTMLIHTQAAACDMNLLQVRRAARAVVLRDKRQRR
jgi:hypothetical protein